MYSTSSATKASGHGRQKRSGSVLSASSSLSESSKIRLPKSRPTSYMISCTATEYAAGSFTLTSSAHAALQLYAAIHVGEKPSPRRRHTQPQPSFKTEQSSDLLAPPHSHPNAPPHSRSFSTPVISRTSPSADDIATATTPPTPHPENPGVSREEYSQTSSLNPVLATLERKSKLCTRVVCSTCMKPGLNYPRCGRCAEMWCSRECRLREGKKHICA